MQAICDEEMNNDANYPYLKEWGLDYALTVTRADGTVENYSSVLAFSSGFVTGFSAEGLWAMPAIVAHSELDYALTVTRADGTVENYSSGHIKQYGKQVYGDEQALVFSNPDCVE